MLCRLRPFKFVMRPKIYFGWTEMNTCFALAWINLLFGGDGFSCGENQMHAKYRLLFHDCTSFGIRCSVSSASFISITFTHKSSGIVCSSFKTSQRVIQIFSASYSLVRRTEDGKWCQWLDFVVVAENWISNERKNPKENQKNPPKHRGKPQNAIDCNAKLTKTCHEHWLPCTRIDIHAAHMINANIRQEKKEKRK